MNKTDIKKILSKQRKFFASGKTLDTDFRINALKRFKETIKKRENDINAALKEDLGKSAFESYMCEVGMTLSEASYMLRHIKKYAGGQRVKTPLAQFPSKSFSVPHPYGNTLIISPWNYPFMLTAEPLIDALSAGNTAIVKPSSYSPATSRVIADLIEEAFPPEYVAVIQGGRQENTDLLSESFDYIFFTGSKAVGKVVLKAAAEYYTPVTLELGGKSPCIIEKSANIPLAARRLVFGKYLNCGQTCVAPDYVLCDAQIKDAFLEEVKKQIAVQYGSEPLKNKDYGKIVNKKHFDRICSLIEPQKVIYGGKSNPETLQIEPTVMDGVTWQDAVMGQEIFGPVMPVIAYESLAEVLKEINERPRPLAFYIFTKNKALAKKLLSHARFGGGCINDVVIHLATSAMPFGGMGESGMGGYHGKAGFDTFSHYNSIVSKSNALDLPMRYHPYTKKNEKLTRRFMK